MDTVRVDASAESGDDRRDMLLNADAATRRELLRAYVRQLCAEVLPEWFPDTPDDEALFFESIAAAEFKAVVERDLEVTVPFTDLAEEPTVAGLADLFANCLDDAGPATTDPGVLVPDVEGRFAAFGLTDVQHAYWLGRSGLFELGGVSAHLYVEFESAGFDVGRASWAFRRLVDRHDMLRAVVRADGRQQVLELVPDFAVSFADLSGLPESVAWERVAEVRERLSHEVRPADVWPLFGVVAQLLPGGRWRVHVSFDLLVADAASIQLLLDEWVRSYTEPGVELAPVGLSFRDYVRALSRLEDSEAALRARDYWLGRLGSLPPAPELPMVGGGGAGRFVRREFVLDRGRWTGLRAAAVAAGVTPSVLVAAAYAEVLAAWSKSRWFTLNVTVGDRLPVHPDVAAVVGDFTSLVLLEVDFREPLGFGERVRGLQRQLWRDLEHRAFGGVRVLRELARVHGVGRAAMPVVFTSVVGREFGGEGGELPGLGRVVSAVSQTPQVLLDHQIYERPDGLVVSWDAVEELFPAGLLDAAFAEYERLLCRLADDPGCWHLDRLIEAPEEHRAHTRSAFDDVPEGLLHQAVTAYADADPQRVAVVSTQRTLTYGELISRSRRVARRLAEWGIRRGDLVAVCMDKGWEQVVAVLGVLDAAAGYVPIDASWPQQRIADVCRQTRVRVMLTQRAVAGRVDRPAEVRVESVDDDEVWAGVDDRPVPVAGEPTDVAYVIFTSGSTGRPKGVVIDHRGALNTVVDVNRRFEIGPGDRVLAVSSLSFDLSVWDIFGPLSVGGAMVLPDPGTSRDPEHWARLVAEERVTIWNSVPALFELIVQYVTDQPRARDLPVRLALLSGDWIPLSLPDRARQALPGLRPVSLGGATEGSIWSIFHPIEEVDPAWPSIPYGRPLTNQTVLVLDEQLEPRPVWAVGELYIGGVGVAKGYWGDPERTAERFIIHPRTGAYLYRTGDLGRLLPDGTIEFLGREDFQVKVGGFRIELGEIETVILTHPAVAAAAVTTIGDPRGAKRLAAYLVPEASAAVSGDEIKELCQRKLPSYMVPTTVTVLPELPLTPNGKVDRSALPAPHARRAHTPPATPVERILAEIWAELLSLETVSTTDNLFELGADSLLALRVVAAVDARGLALGLRDLFANPTIAAQAAAVGAVGADQLPRVERDAAGRFEAFGLTDVQHAYWLGRSGLFELGGVSAHVYVEFESADLDVARASWAFRCLVHRHDMLRAVVRGDGRQQVLASVPDFEVELEDLTGLAEEMVWERVGAVRERLSHEVRPADVWPLFGVVAQALPGARWRVHVSFDLLVADAGSIQVLLDEWVRLYAEPGLVLAPVGITFRDYLRALSQLESSAAFARAREYWLGRLGSLPPAPELPVVAGGDGAGRFVRREFVLDARRWGVLRSAAVGAGVTPSMVIAAAYAEVLAEWSKSRWFTLNVTVGDRLPVHPDVAAVVGDFTSLVLLEVDFREPLGFGERVRGLQRQLWRDLEHRAFGGVRVLRELARVHGVGRAAMPVVFTSVVGREFGGEGGELPGLGRVVSMVSQTPQVLLDHQIYERPDGLVVSWDAVEERFPAGALDAAFAEYERLLHRLADDPDCWALPRLIEADDEHDAALSAYQGQQRPALPARVAPAERVHTPPATPAEQILADIWANLLGLEDVSTTDDLFELGADSLLALRAVADADRRGLKIDLREVFAHPAVRDQATRARAVAGETSQSAAAGPSALTPSQLWFLGQDLPERHHWNDASFLLSLQRPLDLDILRRSLRQVLDHHDALRLRFTSHGGAWTGAIDAPDPDADLPFSVHDFATLTGPQQKKAVTEVSEALQRSLDLADGPLIRVAYFDLGQRPHCLLLLAHWLVVDHFSSRVLLEDLLSCCQQYGAGVSAATLPGRTTPFPVWAAALAERAHSPELVGQLPYWTDPVRRELSPLRLDAAGPNTLESLQTVTLRLDHDVTEAVLRSVPRAFGTNIAAVLCTALVRSLPLRTPGERRVLIDLERHGRDLGLPGLDIGRTVGRFSTIAPIMLELDHRADAAESLATIGRQLAAVPDQGHAYGMLRYLSEHGEQLRRMPPAQVGLNYVGQVDELFLRSDLLSVPRMSYGEQRSSTGTRFRPLDVLGYVMGRRLSFTVGYSTNLHSPATAESFAADFRAELERLADRAEES